MKTVLAVFLAGMAIGTAGPLLAQNIWSGSDSSGNRTTIYENSPGLYQSSNSKGQTGTMYPNSPGLYQWNDSQGRSGTMQQMSPAPSMGRNPC